MPHPTPHPMPHPMPTPTPARPAPPTPPPAHLEPGAAPPPDALLETLADPLPDELSDPLPDAPRRAPLSIVAAHTAAPPPRPADRPKPAARDRARQPDLVDRLLDFIVEIDPTLATSKTALEAALRDEFGGDRGHVRNAERAKIVDEVLRMFNGRNATEIARRLGCTRPYVYRCIKQAGVAK